MQGHPHLFEGQRWDAAFSAFDARALSPSAVPPPAGRTQTERQLRTALDAALDEDTVVDWSEEDIVFLHWRLLQEVNRLADPATPLEEKFDTLRWVFTERSKDGLPFSFANCLQVVGCSPLSPIAYCGRVDIEEVRDRIRSGLRAWLPETLQRYPDWVREAVARNPEWAESQLARNPQWINEQLKQVTRQGDLFV